ncbi:hypothetical protein ACFL20_00390 [Spirochaetota bacterium]
MELSPNVQVYNISDSIQNLNEMLKNLTNVQMDVGNKLLKVNVTSKVAGLGENIDIRA